ncbi:MAG: cobalamin-independent methionine synthase II family protein [Solirubrobacterales bacterium]|nr:cobalamin-independent methionine synthase II family protein [Solirubrobacterales bacterium]MBV9809978.1 cobalamin-independent methionine synthase II family protein [Solirubrobacterales bacterium]
MADGIRTTHAGSLPRPDDLADMIWARMDGQDVDDAELQGRIASAVGEVVGKQREAGIDFISDGEMSKTGFSTYINERFSGFEGRSEFQADDVADFPNLAMRLFATPAMAHLVFSNCVGPVELSDKDAVHRDIERLKKALEGAEPASAFMGAISPGQIAFNYPDQHYGSHEKYLAACADALSYEYKAIADAGFKLQIDSPDVAMAAHCRSVGSSVGDWHHHLPLAIEALNGALEGIPPEQVRFHVCWGNYGGPHHKDVPLADIIDHVLKVNAETIYVEGGNPRHEHEYRVFEDVDLGDKRVILGTIDTKSNFVEHPQVVADRLVRLGRIIGKERLIAGTDCGFDTFIRFSLVDPGVAWLKLQALSEGAAIASEEL